MKHIMLLSSLFLLSFNSGLIQAQANENKPLTTLSDCVIQEVLPGRTMTAAFVTFNHEGEAVDIIEGSIPTVSEHIELHSMSMVDNVMSMGPLENTTLESGQRFFKKGGDHVMIMNIPEDKIPQIGETHTMTFKFSDDTRASCDALVKSLDDVMQEHTAQQHRIKSN